IDIFDVAFHIIGGGEEGDKTLVRTKEEADHSLQYMVSAALLDGPVMPEQYEQERIEAEDIQSLLQRVNVSPNQEFSKRFPGEMPVKLTVNLKDGNAFQIEKRDYEKFERLADPYTSIDLREKIIHTIQNFEEHSLSDLTQLLAEVEQTS
ncbi:MAG: MmgE/PrpD family protein, partial [Bacteroidetes bacterium]|nr:MmgE/PrpD family protein [Bacteroidota bacterium]